MACSSQTIHDMFAALESAFGPFPTFEDVPDSVLDAEKAGDARLSDLPKIVRDAAA